jgi:hypothetical protein
VVVDTVIACDRHRRTQAAGEDRLEGDGRRWSKVRSYFRENSTILDQFRQPDAGEVCAEPHELHAT